MHYQEALEERPSEFSISRIPLDTIHKIKSDEVHSHYKSPSLPWIDCTTQMIEQDILATFKVHLVTLTMTQCGLYNKQLDNQMQR